MTPRVIAVFWFAVLDVGTAPNPISIHILIQNFFRNPNSVESGVKNLCIGPEFLGVVLVGNQIASRRN